MTYLLTFTTYGTHLRGDPRGSIDRHENKPGQPTLDPSPHLHSADQSRLQSPPVTLDEPQRRLVLESIQQTCDYRGWLLLAAHVRTNHVHAIISSDTPAEHILRDLKAYASRHLNRAHGHTPKRWTRGGSTRSLPCLEAIQAATRYVIDAQGSPMALYLASAPG
jgi:hypothetical protein